MGASLAVIFANISMKIFEEKLSTEDEMSLGEKKLQTKMSHLSFKKGCGIARCRVQKCENWYHLKCQNISKEQ